MPRGTGTIAKGGITSVLRRNRNQIKPLSEYLTMSDKKLGQEFFIAPYEQRREVFCLLAKALREGEVEENKALNLAEILLRGEYLHQVDLSPSERIDLGVYGSKHAWAEGINKFYETEDSLLDQVEQAGVDVSKLGGYFKRDPFSRSLSPSRAQESLTLHLLKKDLDPKENITVSNLVERGYIEAEKDAAQHTKNDLKAILTHRPVLLNEKSDAKDLTRALSQLLSSIHSEIHFAGPRRNPLGEGRLIWQVLQDDWHAWRNYNKEVTDEVPEGLRHSFHRPSNAITALSEALNIPEEKTARAIEKIAETVEK